MSTKKKTKTPKTLHKLKIWPEFVKLMNNDLKPYTIRFNDRLFKAGDMVLFQEYDPVKNEYTGREGYGCIVHVFDNQQFLKKGYVILTINMTTYIDFIPF